MCAVAGEVCAVGPELAVLEARHSEHGGGRPPARQACGGGAYLPGARLARRVPCIALCDGERNGRGEAVTARVEQLRLQLACLPPVRMFSRLLSRPVGRVPTPREPDSKHWLPCNGARRGNQFSPLIWRELALLRGAIGDYNWSPLGMGGSHT